MKFLLFFVSILFSLIFYIFYSFSIWKDIFGKNIGNTYNFDSFSWNLLVESFIFLLIWIIFLYIFSDLKWKWSDKLKNYKTEIIYFIFYIILFFQIYFFNENIGLFSIIILIIFIIWDILFNHISNITSLNKQKEKIRYSWLLINYLVSYLSLFLIYKEKLTFIPLYIILFSIIFNILVHKKYTNYISLVHSIILICFLLYILYFFLYSYYDYIIIFFTTLQ